MMIQTVSLGYKMDLLETRIRNKATSSAQLRKDLFDLGCIMGEEILGQCKLSPKQVFTPLFSLFHGVESHDDNGITVIISTKDDYSYFAQGIAKGCDSTYRGYIDFDGARGQEVYSSSYRSIDLPEINPSLSVKRVIIAKSVIASGCTAITLAKTALTKYFPEDLIIVAPFYSQQGVNELQAELRKAKIFVAFGPDQLNGDNMLVPGIGNIDSRLAG